MLNFIRSKINDIVTNTGLFSALISVVFLRSIYFSDDVYPISFVVMSFFAWFCLWFPLVHAFKTGAMKVMHELAFLQVMVYAGVLHVLVSVYLEIPYIVTASEVAKEALMLDALTYLAVATVFLRMLAVMKMRVSDLWKPSV